MLKLSPKVRYSERFQELEPARHSVSNNNKSLGIGYIVNQANYNKKFALSIIEFLKEIGGWCRMQIGKNISSKMNLEGTSNSLAFKYTLCNNVIMSMSSASRLTNIIPSNEHIMLLYSSDDERNDAAVNYINNGLKSGYQCIYASINAYDSKSSSNISNLSAKIDNYKENIERDELRIVDFKPYYESALNVDFRPFKKLKMELEETLNHRKSEGKKDAILVFADAACFLSHNKQFEECEILEWWWHETTTEWKQNNQNITVVCPHPGLVLNNPLLPDTKGRLNGTHTITIDLKQSTAENQKRKPKRS